MNFIAKNIKTGEITDKVTYENKGDIRPIYDEKGNEIGGYTSFFRVITSEGERLCYSQVPTVSGLSNEEVAEMRLKKDKEVLEKMGFVIGEANWL